MAKTARQNKVHNITFRISPDEKKLIEEAAARSGSDLTGFVLGPALKRAREISARDDSTEITATMRARFIEILERKPSRRLIRNLAEARRGVVD